jgi:hypothetical protein
MNGVTSVSFRETEKGLEVRVHKSKSSSSGKLKKRLPYNFKQLSRQISQAKTSDSARSLVSKMQAKLSWLYKKLKSGEYGENEVSAAIIHAAAMERIAKRKVKHLEEEEAAENGGGIGSAGEDEEIYGKDELKESMEENQEISDEMMQKMLKEIEELEKELAEDSMSEMQDMISCASGNMSEEEIEELKRKHRSSEEKQLTREDLRYLKALFDGLEQEKRQLASGISSFSSGGNDTSFSCGIDCIPEVETMDMDLGGSIDTII